MRIVAVSDLHGLLMNDTYEYPDGDVFVIAGDVLPDLRPTIRQSQWAIEVLKPWLKKRADQFKDIVLTWGNHDFVDTYGDPTAKYLEDMNIFVASSAQTCEIGGKIFYVSPYCRQLPNWAYEASEESLAAMYKWIPSGTDVIISHGPALDYLDKTCNMFGGTHAGSIALKRAIRKVQPSVVICGHIHEAYGSYVLHHHGTSDVTDIYNVSQMDEHYTYRHRPVVIDF